MIKSFCYKKFVYAKIIGIECVEEYTIWMDFIEKKWWKILGVTSDWFKWLRKLFNYYALSLGIRITFTHSC
jgi:hypothetical protein